MITEEQIPIALHKGASFVYLASPTQEYPYKHVIKTVSGGNIKKSEGILNEYQILKKLEGKGVRKLLKKGLLEGKPALWLEYIGGDTLDTKIPRPSGMDLAEFLKLALGMCKQLKILHDESIIHRDLNLKNFVINSKDEVFLLDFQLSTSHDVKYLNFSNSDFITGTFETISPEQTGRVNWFVDNRSDLYSLGILFYEMLTAKSPFSCIEPSEFIYSHLTEIPSDLTAIRKNIPRVLNEIVLKLIQKNPAERYQSVEGLIHDLELCSRSLKSNDIDSFEIGERDISKRLKISEKLYGKEAKLESIQNFFFGNSNSELKLVLLEGDSGTGKNTLAYALNGQIAKHNGVFLQGKFRQDNVHKPLSAFVDIVDSYIQVLQTKPEEHILEWKRKIQSLMGNSVQHLFPFMPKLQEILNLEIQEEPSDVIDNQNRVIYLVAKLLYSLSNPAFPIVIYIDDIHWADENSLNLVQFMLNMSDFKFMNIIGSYRRNEANRSEAFVNFEEMLEGSQFPTKTIQLTNFTLSDTSQLLQDTLECSKSEVKDLAYEIFDKTDGNPFFVRRFVQTIYEDGLLWMDVENLKWKWDVERIHEKSYTNNVVNMLVSKLNQLDKDARNILQIASCYGFSFPSEVLQDFRPDITEESINEMLDQLVADKMIFPIPGDIQTGNRNNYGHVIDYQFSHDKLFEAANQSLEYDTLRAYHWAIGKRILHKLGERDFGEIEDVFNLANHLNKGADSAEKSDYQKLFDINVIAGNKAKSAGSFMIALDYFQRALGYSNNLNLNIGENRNLNLQLAECLQFTGQTAEAEKKYKELLSSKNNKFEQAQIGEKVIHFYANTGRHEDAYRTGVELLALFGKKFHTSPSKPRLIANVVRTKLAIRKYSFSDLLQLEEAKDEEHITVIRIIAAMLKSGYQIAPELAVEGATKMVRYCANKGNTIDSPVGYFVFGGIFLGGVFGQHETGYNFGNLALDLVDRYKSEKQRSEIEFIHGYFANTWVKGPQSTLGFFEKAYKSGSLIGDFFHMSCSRAASAQNMLMFGTPIDQTLHDTRDYQHFVKQSKNREALIALESIERVCEQLTVSTGEVKPLKMFSFDEALFNSGSQEYSSKHFIHMYYVNRMMLAFMQQQFDTGLKYAETGESLLNESSGMQHAVFHHFYLSLLIASKNKITVSKAHFKKLEASVKYLQKCAEFNPGLYECLYEIALSHKQNFHGKQKQAIQTIQSAISDLKSKLEVNLLGIASEHLCRMYWNSQNIRKFHETMAVTFEAYRTWGAFAVLERLKTEFRLKGDLIPKATVDKVEKQHSSTVTAHDLDITSVLKFSRALTEEINLENLVKKVLKIMVENTASTRAYLIIRKGETPYLYASFEENQMESMQRINLREFQKSKRYPVGMIHYVMRTKQALLLDDAGTSEFFSTNNYVVENNTKSVLCQPLLMQQQTIGVLYLDSNMSEQLYDQKKVQLLQLLSTQIAISINNSMNFEELEQTVSERTEELSKQKEIIELKNKEIGESIHYARTIQEAILPDTTSFDQHFNKHFLLSKPKDIVSGDFFWLEEHNNKILFAVADCTGHGVPAAMLSVVCNNALKRAVRELDKSSPGEILDAASAIISSTFAASKSSNQTLRIQDGMDVSLCCFDKDTQELCFSGANNPLLVLSKTSLDGEEQTELFEIKGDKQPVGPYFKPKPFTEHKLKVKKGDIIILTTDGYYDQFGGENSKKMKAKAFKQFLIELSDENFSEYKFRLDAHFSAWKGSELQIDDVTVLGIQV